MTLRIAGLLTLLWLSPAAASAAPPKLFEVRPPADWVEPIAPALEAKAEPASNGVAYLLTDTQVRVGEKTVSRFSHFARRVVAEGGLEQTSELQLNVNPAFERLTVHWVRRIRDGKVEDALARAEVKEVQREESLEARLFDGTQTVLVVLHDIRVGDVIEYAFTVTGQNPVFEGRYAGGVGLRFSVPLHQLRHRVLFPEGRPLRYLAHGMDAPPEVRERGEETEWRWQFDAVPVVSADDMLPDDFDPYPWVQLSEWSSWEQVAGWSVRQFAPGRKVPAKVAAKARELAAAHDGEAARFLAALRFVQDDIRYFGFMMGPNSHRPHAPQSVLERRFGDCKDKALLLTTLLRALEIEAAPALVTTSGGGLISGYLPSPFAFNHVIVRARVLDDAVWVDPTRSLQRGRLRHRVPPPYKNALLVADGSRALTPIPSVSPAANGDEPLTDIEEIFTAKDRTSPVTLKVITRYRGAGADDMRQSLGGQTVEELTRRSLNFYARQDAKIRLVKDVEIQDDEAANVITLTESYVIDDFWGPGRQRQFRAWAIDNLLYTPRISQRTMPLGVSHPVDLRYRLRFLMPEAFPVKPETERLRSKGFRFEADLRAEQRLLKLDYRYRSLKDSLKPDEVAEHLKVQKQVEDALGYQVTLGDVAATANTAAPDGKLLLWSLGYLLGLTALIGVGVFVALRRRPPVLARRVAHVATAPALALAVPTVADAEQWLSGHPCGCGLVLGTAPRQWGEKISMNGREIAPVAVTCPSCGATTWLYFQLTPGAGAGQQVA